MIVKLPEADAVPPAVVNETAPLVALGITIATSVLPSLETTIAVELLPKDERPLVAVASVPAVTLIAEIPPLKPLTVSVPVPALVRTVLEPLSAEAIVAFAFVVIVAAEPKAIVPPVTE